MSLTNKTLDNLTEADLQSLVNNQTRESKTIEYKRDLPGGNDEAKKEVLADISSFANAAGGHLVFGMVEAGGAPVTLCGVEADDIDGEIRRIDSILQAGIKPRLYGVGIQPVPLQNGRFVLIVRVARSWAGPHVVDYKGRWKFYSRNSAGKYPLDVDEVRAAFALSQAATERVRSFRMERLGNIIAGETPYPLRENVEGGVTFVLHSVPLGAFQPGVSIDVSAVASEVSLIAPIAVAKHGQRYNLDGLITAGTLMHDYDFGRAKHRANSYLQLFRNGSIEAAGVLMQSGNEGILEIYELEGDIIAGLDRYLQLQERLGVEPPLVVMLSLFGVADRTIYHPKYNYSGPAYKFERDALVLPEVVVESYGVRAGEAMRSVFDAVWNAGGYPRAMSYDEDGKWVRP